MSEETEYLQLETEIVKALRTVYDPEIPVNIYDLGLIYEVELDEYDNVDITMTLTAPACPMADFILEDTNMKVKAVKGVQKVTINLVFDPPWSQEMMSEEAQLELGLL